MALEAVVFPQDPLINSCSSSNTNNNIGINFDFSNYYSSSSKFLLEESLKLPLNVGLFDVNNNVYDLLSNNINSSEFLIENNNTNNVPQWNQQQYVTPTTYSSPEDNYLYLSGETPPPNTTETASPLGGFRKKRRRRSCKNEEEVEQQRMTHIAVERNRRKQMNEYLAVIRSLMPPSYVQRGDQASIVGGAINYVKELEQLLQSMEAQKGESYKQPRRDNHHQQPPSPQHSGGDNKNGGNLDSDTCTTETTPPSPSPLPFADFFSFPQYSTRSKPNSPGSNSVSCSNSSVGDIEVTMVESHANVKILAKKQTKQLVKIIAGFQGLRLNVLHLNVTTVDSFVLYSLSLKVEEGCQLNSVDDIAAAANHILGQIQEEAIDHDLLKN